MGRQFKHAKIQRTVRLPDAPLMLACRKGDLESAELMLTGRILNAYHLRTIPDLSLLDRVPRIAPRPRVHAAA